MCKWNNCLHGMPFVCNRFMMQLPMQLQLASPAAREWVTRQRENVRPWMIFFSTQNFKVSQEQLCCLTIIWRYHFRFVHSLLTFLVFEIWHQHPSTVCSVYFDYLNMLHSFQAPPSVPRWSKRVTKNIDYFQSNYMFVFIVLILYCLWVSYDFSIFKYFADMPCFHNYNNKISLCLCMINIIKTWLLFIQKKKVAKRTCYVVHTSHHLPILYFQDGILITMWWKLVIICSLSSHMCYPSHYHHNIGNFKHFPSLFHVFYSHYRPFGLFTVSFHS